MAKFYDGRQAAETPERHDSDNELNADSAMEATLGNALCSAPNKTRPVPYWPVRDQVAIQQNLKTHLFINLRYSTP